MHLVQCVKLNKSAEGLAFPPMPGELGQKIYDHISQEAWEAWLAYQTMFINENRLNMAEADARMMVLQALNAFLFDHDQPASPNAVIGDSAHNQEVST